ncbi:Uma2 family endonuclease [Trichothermofontia sichuanensis B231]|uniref:Uma2 family endonuclease n=1 Tax=Trichothermofontia sichuanensis TaxID=3045816 RepID=UPI002247030E|nr:Uma2 family endonuclease [Trichothermofontia sichuanensis]UZQ54031.1 Uma2 family endonuclease [Trichothermofontia sichuanensis B231]
MTPTPPSPTLVPSDTWIPATWAEFLQIVDDPAYGKSKGYYCHGQMRLEMQVSVGFDHSQDHGVIALAINLYGILKGIPFTVLDNCSFGSSEFMVGALRAPTINSAFAIVYL